MRGECAASFLSPQLDPECGSTLAAGKKDGRAFQPGAESIDQMQSKHQSSLALR